MSNITKRNLQINPISSQEMLDAVKKAASKDSHEPLFATHAVIKDGEIVGSFCTLSTTVYWWLDSKKTDVTDTAIVLQSVDTLINNEGYIGYAMPVHPSSPYHKFLINRSEDSNLSDQLCLGKNKEPWTIFLKGNI